MHEDIERFTRDQVIIKDNKDFDRLKEVLIDQLEDEMRLQGVMRMLDIDPQWSADYDQEKDYFVCTLTVYGVFVGEDECDEDFRYSRGRKTKTR